MTGLRTVHSTHAHAGVTAFMTNTAINCKGTQVGPKWDTHVPYTPVNNLKSSMVIEMYIKYIKYFLWRIE